MSLSFWLRDYLYIPLGGNRGGALFVCRNLMITMLLGGLCHGAAWICVVWGALHSVGLCANKLWRDVRQRVPVAIQFAWRRASRETPNNAGAGDGMAATV